MCTIKQEATIIQETLGFLLQVWKVKKAFKIYIFWKGITPTFMVSVSICLWDTCA